VDKVFLSCRLLAALRLTAPAGAWPLACNCVEALEKGVAITCELRLVADQMTPTLNIYGSFAHFEGSFAIEPQILLLKRS